MGILNIETPEKKKEEEEPVEKKPVEQAADDSKQMILMDGPLAAIYTKALDIVYAQHARNNTSQETQQTDMVMVADAHKLMQSAQDEHEEKTKGAYVYVTDEASIQQGSGFDAFNSLRIALDMKHIDQRVFCIENFSDSTRERLLVNYAKQNGYQIFYNRQRLIESLKSPV